MEDFKKNITKITFGIRFNRSFRIPDISGDIIDNILNYEETPFEKDFFISIREDIKRREKILFHKDKKGDVDRYLRINTDDLILAFEIENNFERKFKWLQEDVVGYFEDVLFKDYQIKDICRIGIVFSHKILKSKKMGKAISLLTSEEIKEADDINIYFSKKISQLEALYSKGSNDYKNAIYNFQKLKESVLVELDYQYYYNPSKEDLRSCSVNKILNDAKKFMEGNFYNWLIKYEENAN